MEYIAHLSRDKRLKKIIDRRQPLKLVKRKKIHLDLCGSIMSQQLSTRVAEIIQKRFLGLYGGSPPSPEQILETPFDLLRSIGLSNAKTRYIHNVARFAIESGIEHEHLRKKDNEQVIEYLTQIKGVGRWTAEMLLIFTLGREDVFAAGDLGIQKAMVRLYKLDTTDKKLLKEEMIQISEKWSPYRTYACLHLWRWKDNNPLK
ncbi:MAG TPA: DNA-3-methyladenine glycosylase [Puia sp.]|nr:DNA-3-methyladenine glycosylase [Puia sp.]